MINLVMDHSEFQHIFTEDSYWAKDRIGGMKIHKNLSSISNQLLISGTSYLLS